MSSVGPIGHARLREAQFKQQRAEMKQMQDNHTREYRKIVKKNEEDLERLQSEMREVTTRQESETERKLMAVRNKQKERILLENQRLNAELEDLKKAHQFQVDELKETQKNELDEMANSHKTQLENARLKFRKSLSKYESA